MKLIRSILMFVLVAYQGIIMAQVQTKIYIHIDCDTPIGDSIFLVEKYIQTHKLIKDTPADWHVTLDLPPNYTLNYVYCRNRIWFGADEFLTDGWDATRHFQGTYNSVEIKDTIYQWKWWPVDGQFQIIDQSSHVSQQPDTILQRKYQAGVFLPDWWDPTFLYNVNNTLDSIVEQANANFVEFCPIPEITQLYPTPLIVREGNNGIPEASLKYVLQAVEDRGLGLYLHPFSWELNVSDPSPGYHTDDWWIAYEAQWRPIMLYYAQMAEDYHAKVFNFSLWPSVWSISSTEEPIIDTLAIRLLRDVREVYHGKIAVEYSPFGPDLQLYGEGDFLHFVISDFFPYSLGNDKQPTVDEMFQNLRTGLAQLYKDSYLKWGKKLIIGSLAASSYDGTVINQPGWESQLYYYPDDNVTSIDMQEQADAYEAMIHAIAECDWIDGIYSFNYNYWNGYDKSPSIRNKPAEKVVAKWYRWLNPDLVHLSVSSNEGGSCLPAQGAFVIKKDSSLTLQAFPANGYAFSQWEGDVEPDLLTQNPIFLHMDKDKKIRALFVNMTSISNCVVENKDNLSVFPNPVMSSMQIKYHIDNKSHVFLALYSLDGKLIRTLVNKTELSGDYTVNWQLTPYEKLLAEEIYELIMRTPTSKRSQKIVLVK